MPSRYSVNNERYRDRWRGPCLKQSDVDAAVSKQLQIIQTIPKTIIHPKYSQCLTAEEVAQAAPQSTISDKPIPKPGPDPERAATAAFDRMAGEVLAVMFRYLEEVKSAAQKA